MAIGPPFVLKVGGDIVANGPSLHGMVEQVKACVDAGGRVVIIHGGGPQATALTHRLGLSPNVVGGRRITSPEVLDVMKMTLAGAVSVDLAAAFRAHGVEALGLSGVSAGLVEAVKRPPRVVSGCGEEPVDFGEVGDVIDVNADAIHRLLNAGFVPVISSLAATAAGRVLNINGDIVACHVAVSLQAKGLILLTKTDGVFRDLSDPSTRFPRLTVAEAQTLIDDGIVHSGMIPKLEEAFRVLRAGVSQVRICAIGGASILSEDQPVTTASGTLLVP